MTEPTDNQVDPNAKGLPPGVNPADTGEGNRGDGAPQAPVINNAPPAVEPTAEEKASAEAAEKAKLAEAEQVDENNTEDEQKQDDEPVLEYPKYDDDNANAVVDILQEAKITAQESNDLFKEAVESGDFTKINMTVLTEKLGAAKANLVLLGVKAYYDKVTGNTKETVNAVHQAVGGKANYDKVLTWARTEVQKNPQFAKQVEGFNQMFDLNTTAALMAAKELVSLYEKAGNSSLVHKQVHGDQASTTSNTNNDYLSRHDYLEKMKAAQLKNDNVEIARLRNQRKASLNQ